MGTIIGWILEKFLGTTGQPVSNGIVNTVASLSVLTPVFLWLMKYDDTAAIIFKLPPWFEVTFSWGQFAFLILLGGIIIKFAHWTKSPTQ